MWRKKKIEILFKFPPGMTKMNLMVWLQFWNSFIPITPSSTDLEW